MVAATTWGNGGIFFCFVMPDPFDPEPAKILHWTDLMEDEFAGRKMAHQPFVDCKPVRRCDSVRATPGKCVERVGRKIKAHNAKIRQSRLERSS